MAEVTVALVDATGPQSMTRVRLSIDIPAPTERVWEALADLGSHPDWMQDAVAIQFVTDQRRGVGTAVDCETRIGPLQMTDRIEVTEWDELHKIAVTHKGVVSGSGSFALEPTDIGSRVTWIEDLHFPLWMAGPVGGALAKPIFISTWRKNLKNLRSQLSKTSDE